MNTREKILLCAGPYLLAGYLWFSLTSPTYNEGHVQDTELSKKRQEQIELKTKLLDLHRLEKERTNLEQNITSLRAAVPKSPDVDLLVIDLEKMATDSGLDVVSIGPPEEDQEGNEETEGLPPLPGKNPLEQPLKADPKKPTPAAAKADKGKSLNPEPVDSGLSQHLLQVKLTGDYPALVGFMHKFDSYERVVDISRISAEIPGDKESDKDEDKNKDPKGSKATMKADPKMLDMSLLMNAYYLP